MKDNSKEIIVNFHIKKLESLTDEEIQEEFPDRDGRWSIQTKRALRRFQTEKLDLNENWASVGPDWTCPCCERSKYDLFRLSVNQILLANLHVHHDHLADFLKEKLHQKFGSKWAHCVSRSGIYLEDVGSKLIGRFAPCLVCADCNAADGAAKAGLPTLPRFFSFRVSEICKFIQVSPNSEHKVSLNIAMGIFIDVEKDFQKRVLFLDQLFNMILCGDLLQEEGNVRSNKDINPYNYINNKLIKSFYADYKNISNDINGFLRRSLSRDGVSSNSPSKKVTIDIPTQEDYLNHDGSGGLKIWQETPESWSCPCCSRVKFQILRRSNKSKKKKWSGRILKHTQYVLMSPENWDDPLSWEITGQNEEIICMDCASVIPKIKQMKPELSRDEVFFQIEDIRELVKASPHQGHEVNWEQAVLRAYNSLQRTPAVDFYNEKRNRLSVFSFIYGHFSKIYNNENDIVLGAVRQYYIEKNKINEVDVDDFISDCLNDIDFVK
ncbi:hypothetical protein [Gluconacetobacter diazotrophicus]|uniref:hypothetical protein n=1 Tax=Gluconacetobacter diazotrophicus TaxID=33996 RepID=UPI00119BDB6F|nr:hypothetical protein [Gluconacetobacter diazotrophicus]TWB03518.1 hypothetical protein FBZ86_12063 [Gluconacetobacter diazotrophicus]